MNGTEWGIRTPNLRDVNALLKPLSYKPDFSNMSNNSLYDKHTVAEDTGLEPVPRVNGELVSNQLQYHYA